MKTIGIVGLGSIGSRHAKNLLAMGHHVFGYDISPEKMDALVAAGGSSHGSKGELYTCVEAVVIATPTPYHCDSIVDVPLWLPLLAEKPIVSNPREWYSLKESPLRGKTISVGNNLRFHSCVKKAKKWLDEDAIGQPLWAEFTCSQFNMKYTDDVVLNWGAHELDLARYLLGDMMVTHASGNSSLVDIILQPLAWSGQVAVHLDYLGRPEVRGFSILGTRGNIHATLSPERRAFLDMKEDKSELTLAGDSYDENYIEEMRAFLDTIDGKKSSLLATGEDGLACLELILKAKKLAGIK